MEVLNYLMEETGAESLLELYCFSVFMWFLFVGLMAIAYAFETY